jgi:inhibitor of cysteine peptidase
MFLYINRALFVMESDKMKNMKNINWAKVLTVCVLAIAVIVSSAAVIQALGNNDSYNNVNLDNTHVPDITEYDLGNLIGDNELISFSSDLDRFTSFQELKKFLEDKKDSQQSYYARINGNDIYKLSNMDSASVAEAGMMMGADSTGTEYSTTNIQVAGVEEGDIVKNDAGYAYVVSSDKKAVVIVEVYPPEEMNIVSKITVDGEIEDMYLVEDKLIIIEQCYYFEGGYYPTSYLYSDDPSTMIKIYDVSARENPMLWNNVTLPGVYSTSRIIDGFIYLITTESAYNYEEADDLRVKAEEIYYIDQDDYNFNLNYFISLDFTDINAKPKIVPVLMGTSNNIYVSQQNIFITYTKYNYMSTYTAAENTEKTVIHKLAIYGEGDITYIAQGEVPGHVLNRYSMDEYNGYFRIATSMGWMVDNMLYVLDENLNIAGNIEDIAPGEGIYSARFMGNRCYLVTFKQVDPFFVIDLSNPQKPEILGELKITGYSDYLHPYDETHIIGLGKDTVDTGQWARFQGVKVSLFDVTNVSNPIEIDKFVIIGDRGTESLALDDPHAFLFSKDKNLLVIPITLYELDNSSGDVDPSTYGYYTWEGAYVLHVDETGITLDGRIAHEYEDEPEYDYDYYCYYNQNRIKRSFYIDDVLYTVSDHIMMANELANLDEIKKIELDG